MRLLVRCLRSPGRHHLSDGGKCPGRAGQPVGTKSESVRKWLWRLVRNSDTSASSAGTLTFSGDSGSGSGHPDGQCDQNQPQTFVSAKFTGDPCEQIVDGGRLSGASQRFGAWRTENRFRRTRPGSGGA